MDYKKKGVKTMIELKPCPFCGCESVMETMTVSAEKIPRYRVRCGKCFCQTNWDNFSQESAAIRWNRRATDDKR